MANISPNQPGNPTPVLENSGKRRIIQVFGFILLIGLIMFLCAGRLDWPQAWIFLGGYLLSILGLLGWGLHSGSASINLINERGRMAENVKSWDKVLISIYTVALLALFVVTGLDARFRWSVIPVIWQIVGFICLCLAMFLILWVTSVNRRLSTMVRIQDDRGQQVVTNGPYRYVRHPMYVGTVLFAPGIPLLLGSWWALIPAGLIIVIFIIRTAMEDKTLMEELPGYAEYTRQVRYRLIPGIW